MSILQISVLGWAQDNLCDCSSSWVHIYSIQMKLFTEARVRLGNELFFRIHVGPPVAVSFCPKWANFIFLIIKIIHTSTTKLFYQRLHEQKYFHVPKTKHLPCVFLLFLINNSCTRKSNQQRYRWFMLLSHKRSWKKCYPNFQKRCNLQWQIQKSGPWQGARGYGGRKWS